MTEQCSTDVFDRCWGKNNPKFRQTIIQKVVNKGLEPTKETCRNHWLGVIKPYTYPKSGRVEHLHIDDINKRRKIYGTARSMENKHRKKDRRPYK
jgi:hypothetical protein